LYKVCEVPSARSEELIGDSLLTITLGEVSSSPGYSGSARERERMRREVTKQMPSRSRAWNFLNLKQSQRHEILRRESSSPGILSTTRESIGIRRTSGAIKGSVGISFDGGLMLLEDHAATKPTIQ
jgi:hypothetical protein